jgi:hypothetical protein
MKRLMNAAILAALMAITLTSGALAQEKKETDKKGTREVGALLVSATADEVAKDFADDAKKARDKYTPKKAAPGVKAGTVVELKGTVAYTEADGSLQTKTAKGWTVVFKGKVEGQGPEATIAVDDVATGSKIVVFYGKITRSKKKAD